MRLLARLFCLAVIAIGITVGRPVLAAGTGISMSILGKQEQIKRVPVVSFSENVSSSSGTASGKRQHKLILVTKEADATSSQLSRAQATNEVLKEVVFEFTRSVGGKSEVYRTVTLSHAQIVRLERKRSGKNKAPIEEISFAYEQIKESKGGKTVVDQWIK